VGLSGPGEGRVRQKGLEKCNPRQSEVEGARVEPTTVASAGLGLSGAQRAKMVPGAPNRAKFRTTLVLVARSLQQRSGALCQTAK